MARLGYAVHVALPGRLQPEMIRSFQGISGLWHQFCQEGEAFCAGWKRRVVKGGADSGGVGGRAKRQKRKVPTVEETERQMVVGLRTLMGPTSTWRSVKQRESMQAILSLRGDQGAICILPTGAGKSLLSYITCAMDSMVFEITL
jgi:superfamily II DNA helicase RecQ